MTRPLFRVVGYAALIAAAFFAPYVIISGPARLLTVTALLYALLATSWNLTIGFGGIFNFAHVGFFGIGGYAMAVSTVSWDWNPWWGLVLGGAVGAVAAVIAFLPAIRMRGIYVALVTFIFVQLCFYLVLAVPGLTGGSNGLPGVPGLSIGEFRLADAGGLGYLWLAAFAVVALLIVLHLVVGSSFGRSLIALRDNEQLAISRGISRIRQQLLSFVLSGAIAGVAGALYVSYFRVADTTLFSFGFVTLGLSMMFLGGTGHIWGPVLGAIVVTFVDRSLTSLGAWQLLIIGAGTVLVLIFLPKGLAGLIDSGARALVGRFIRRKTAAEPNSPTVTDPTGRETDHVRL
jgi:branched-chain amino acid transport system permease protein